MTCLQATLTPMRTCYHLKRGSTYPHVTRDSLMMIPPPMDPSTKTSSMTNPLPCSSVVLRAFIGSPATQPMDMRYLSPPLFTSALPMSLPLRRSSTPQPLRYLPSLAMPDPIPVLFLPEPRYYPLASVAVGLLLELPPKQYGSIRDHIRITICYHTYDM
jgi:hypothetical protein